MNSGLKFEPKRILVFRIGHLGDTLVALPAFWALRKRFPDAHITLLSNASAKNAGYPTARGVLPAKGIFDEIITYPNETGKIRSVLALLKLSLTIRRKKIDTLFYLMTRNRDARRVERDSTIFYYSGVRQQIGMRYLKDNFLPENGIAPLPDVEPEFRYLLKCLAEEMPEIDPEAGICTDLLLTEGEKNAAFKWLQEKCGDALTGKSLVAVAPGSKWESKLWDEKNYIETLSRLITSSNIFPVIFGGPEDRDKGERILEAVGAGANAAGELSIREAAAALEYCRLYLGNDTGTMHLAAAVGVPVMAVFAAIDYPMRWFPYGKHNIVIRRQVPCEGCHSPICKFNHECLEIGIDEVYRACLSLLDKKGSIG